MGKVSGKTHTKAQLDHWANLHNPNNKAYRADADNRANQMNPNHRTHQRTHNANRRNRQYCFSICSCLLHSISIYVIMLMLNCWTVLNFDRSYHESTNDIERQ